MRSMRLLLALLSSMPLLGAGASQLAVRADQGTAAAFKSEQVGLRIVAGAAEWQFHCGDNLHWSYQAGHTCNGNISKLGRPLCLPASEPSSSAMLNKSAIFPRAGSRKKRRR
jgi:hypothetical protein